MDELGYDVEWHLYNSKDYGVPQNRERIYIIGHSRRYGRREILPFGRENGAVVSEDALKVVRVGNVNPSGNGMNGNVYSDAGLSPTLTTNKGEGTKIMLSDNTIIDDTQEGFNGIKVYNGYAPTLRSSRYGLKVAEITKEEPKILIKEATEKGYAEASVNYSIPTSKTRRGRVGKGIANTLDTGCQQGVVVRDMRIRKLTPLECWRLQGFSDELFYKAQAVNSNSQLYKQAGNSVTVNVVYEVAKHLGGKGD